MARIKGRDTRPELLLRQALWRRGLRYRVNKRVEGVRPDVVFPTARIAIFVDGCFWHACPLHGTHPASNQAYWQKKLARNVERDAENNRSLHEAGWHVVRLWEHEILEDPEAAASMIAKLLLARAAQVQ